MEEHRGHEKDDNVNETERVQQELEFSVLEESRFKEKMRVMEDLKRKTQPVFSEEKHTDLASVDSPPIDDKFENKLEDETVVLAECLDKTLAAFSKRKLLILDVNGVLADIVHPPPKGCNADIKISGRAVFKRPFYYEFLKFCFERFNVAIWSSRSKKINDKVVDYLLGEMRQKLLFCWYRILQDAAYCTETGFKTIENMHKPLFCKDLSKVWQKQDPSPPWEKEDYNESNTLLLDDSPYKALFNPMHSAIFPKTYNFKDSGDNSLGPGGDLRIYLEALAVAENVQEYVKQHPFGQSAINESNPSWNFYVKVLCSRSRQVFHPDVEDHVPADSFGS